MNDTTLSHPDAEVACLGACLIDADAAQLVAEQLRPQDWTQDRHADVHAAIRQIVSRGEHVDRLTLYTEIGKRPHDGISAAWLLDLEAAVPTAANTRHYLALVKAATLRRQIRAACQRTMIAMENPEASIQESVAHLSEDLEHSLGAGEQNGRALVPVTLAAALTAWRTEWQDGRQPARVKTPCAKLNTCLGGGFGPGELIYLGARPGTGKTAFATEIARTAAEAGTGVLVISREMVVGSLTRRILSQHSRIPASIIKAGRFEDAHYAILTRSYGHLATLPLWLMDQAITLPDIRRLVERWAFTPPLGLVIVDYLQLVRTKAESRRLEVEAVSQGLKSLAVKCHLPILCLSSLSRPEKGSETRRPTLSDLRESGELEHDADVVLFLHRGFQEEETTLIVAKNRDGRVGETTLRFRPEYVAFDRAEGGTE